jgi:hypothetical protein
MIVHEAVGIVVALIVLAGVATVVVNGGQSAAVFKAAADGLATDLKVAEGRG